MLAELTHTHFEPHVGSIFDLELNDTERLPLRLIEVQTSVHGGAAARRSFSLIFRSDLPGVLPQAIYRLDHPTMGALGLFIVPIGRDAVGMQYQAIFG